MVFINYLFVVFYMKMISQTCLIIGMISLCALIITMIGVALILHTVEWSIRKGLSFLNQYCLHIFIMLFWYFALACNLTCLKILNQRGQGRTLTLFLTINWCNTKLLHSTEKTTLRPWFLRKGWYEETWPHLYNSGCLEKQHSLASDQQLSHPNHKIVSTELILLQYTTSSIPIDTSLGGSVSKSGI